jgi:hypothetical protein
MRFATVAVMAGTAAASDYMVPSAASSVEYTTQMITVTACPPTVTNCPASAMTTSVTSNVVPLTTSTVYSTQVHTITSCAPTVTNCPAHSTVLSTEVIAVSTTVCPLASLPSAVPIYSNNTIPAGLCGGMPCPATTGPAVPVGPSAPVGPAVPAVPAGPAGPATTAAAQPGAPGAPPAAPSVCVPTHSVTAITKSYTTVLTSVEYSTVEVPCPTQAAAAPTGVAPPPAYPPASGNKTAPTKGPVTAGASSFAGSALLAAAAGVAAYVFA